MKFLLLGFIALIGLFTVNFWLPPIQATVNSTINSTAVIQDTLMEPVLGLFWFGAFGVFIIAIVFMFTKGQGGN